MKITRKGFTLVELLIVVAIIASLSAMMMMASSESIDTANANAILSNLQSMKVSAYEMYMEEPKVASNTNITNDTEITIQEAVAAGENNNPPAQEAVTKKVSEILGARLGRKDLAPNYGIVGDGSSWYVYYTLTDEDTAKVKTALANKAKAAGLLGATGATVALLGADDVAYYDDQASTAQTVIALKVR